MASNKAQYINLLSDLGFNLIFRQAAQQLTLLAIVNALLPEQQLQDVIYRPADDAPPWVAKL